MNPAIKQVSLILQQELKYLSGLYPYDLKKSFDSRLVHCANIFAFIKDAKELPAALMERLVNLAAGIELLSIGANHHNFNIGDFIKIAESISASSAGSTNIASNSSNSSNSINSSSTNNAISVANTNSTSITSSANNANNAAIATGTISPDIKTMAEISKPNTKSKAEKSLFKDEKEYTIDLLFGDIFYSRAVIYLLKYGDHNIFESILDSLKAVHKSRLILHQKLAEVSGNIRGAGKDVDFDAGVKDLLEDNIIPVLGVNSLYKTSLLIGWGLLGDTNIPILNNPAASFSNGSSGPAKEISGVGQQQQVKFPYEAVNALIMTKALNDLDGFFKALPGEYFFLKKIKYIYEKKAQIRKRLNIIISGFKPGWLKENFISLEKLYL